VNGGYPIARWVTRTVNKDAASTVGKNGGAKCRQGNGGQGNGGQGRWVKTVGNVSTVGTPMVGTPMMSGGVYTSRQR